LKAARKTKSKQKGGYPSWTDENMAKVEARWPRGTRERVMFDILVNTGFGSATSRHLAAST
jgi:hypothetical protein